MNYTDEKYCIVTGAVFTALNATDSCILLLHLDEQYDLSTRVTVDYTEAGEVYHQLDVYLIPRDGSGNSRHVCGTYEILNIDVDAISMVTETVAYGLWPEECCGTKDSTNVYHDYPYEDLY